MATWLRWLCWLTGVACMAIGVLHVALGTASVPGEGAAGATVDSRERFYAAVFFGYGVAWLWASRERPLPAVAVRWLAGVFFAGGVGRLVSAAVHGWPHWFQVVLMAIELVLPVVVLALSVAPRDSTQGRDAETRRREAAQVGDRRADDRREHGRRP